MLVSFFRTLLLCTACLLPLCWLSTAQVEQPASLTWVQLLHETHDLTALTQLSPYPFTTHQASSFDRLSVTPQRPDEWFANHDRGHCLYEGTVEAETPYFAQPPTRTSKPTATMPAGTHVGIARHKRNVPGYLFVYSYDGPDQPAQHQGYISTAAYTPHPLGSVLADIQGPGCVTRFWSSNPGEAGKVRIYLDNQLQQLLEAKLLDLLSGQWEVQAGDKKVKPIPSPWASEKARGYEMVFPIVFRQRCIIVADRPNVQYQVQWRNYAAEAPVASLTIQELMDQQPLITKLAEQITGLNTPSTAQLSQRFAPSEKPDVQQVTLEQPLIGPGQSRQMDLLQGPGNNPSRAIVLMEASVQADRMVNALRNVVLSINFDSAKEPQIEVPLGDFFGTAPGANTLGLLPWRASPNGKLTSHWVMPYAKHARLSIKNLDEQPVTVQLSLTHVPYSWNDQSLYFHSSWRTASFTSRPFQDWAFLQVQGTGQLVGTHLAVYNPAKEWWGEGDSKIWIDGHTFPSLWGTGTDDDFGFGWSDKTLFSSPWRAQPRHDGQRTGHEGSTSLLRARLLDRISFARSLRYDLEVRHDQPNVNMQYAATSFWYALPGAKLERMNLTADVLRGSLPGGQP